MNDAALIQQPVALRRPEMLTFDRIVVIGGGCYGTWYTRQLRRAQISGALFVNEILVVDRNPACQVMAAFNSGEFAGVSIRIATQTWADYLSAWLAVGPQSLERQALVPSPLMPHLLLDWLVMRAAGRWPHRRVSVEPLQHAPRIPWERAAPDGRHYVSFAEWMCPINCIEPALCPATGGPRSWSMPPALHAYVAAQPENMPLDGPVLFHCVHRTHGVGMIDAAPIAQADIDIAALGSSRAINVLVGTVSHCHGALGLLSAR